MLLWQRLRRGEFFAGQIRRRHHDGRTVWLEASYMPVFGVNQQVTSVIKVGPQLHADVEGLALYQSDKHDYLVISSQGNDSYLVVDAEPPFAVHGGFRVGLNAAAGIDGASETDGDASFHNEGIIEITDIVSASGASVSQRDLEISFKTLWDVEGHWLDTGLFDL